ncbi:hypothetical protein SteCoe_39703 [Stentor coeruleus]|uniref:Uncharacterized protein n=1 Tax=Stentor coeruleus TaxID=5963 RepID=A0A1R2AKH4_9CILI|nr:hypothetical protein SteCoe_39703 [Stentor coeruleus]
MAQVISEIEQIISYFGPIENLKFLYVCDNAYETIGTQWKGRVIDIREYIKDEFFGKCLKPSLDESQKQINEQVEVVKTIENKVEVMSGNLKAVSDEVKTVSEEVKVVKTIENKVEVMSGDIKTVSEEVKTVSDEVKEVKTSMNNLSNRVEDIEKSISNIQGSIELVLKILTK